MRFIILHLGVNVHRYFAVLMACQILNRFRVNGSVNEVSDICVPLRYNNDKPENPSNDGRFEGLSHLFHSFSNHEKAGQKS